MVHKAATDLAMEIMSSWNQPMSNYILIVPPLIPFDSVFKMLCDTELHKKYCDYPDQLDIAHLREADYKNSRELVDKICKAWSVKQKDSCIEDPIQELEQAVNTVVQRDRIPIILLPRFHKAIERLPENLGAALRSMEYQFNLRTVVQVPVPLSELFDRWEYENEKRAFLCSNFGQGHLNRLLLGQTRSEVHTAMKSVELSEKIANIVYEWTGGLPILVKWVVREATRINSKNDIEKLFLPQAIEQSWKFLKWIDPPGSNAYKQLLAEKYLNVSYCNVPFSLSDHQWTELLIDKDGSLRIKTIGLAALKYLGGSQMLKIDKLAYGVNYLKECEWEISKLIKTGENKHIEFKETMRWNMGTNQKSPLIEFMIIKCLAGFMNSDGGVLLVGIDDDGNPVGLLNDRLINNDGSLNEDLMMRHIVSLIIRHMGIRFTQYISQKIETLDDGSNVLRICCGRSYEPVYLKHDNRKVLYVRTGPRIDEVLDDELNKFIETRFL